MGKLLLLGLIAFANVTQSGAVKVAPVKEEPATLNLEIAILYRNGDVKPAARAKVWVFDADPGKMLVDAGIAHPEPTTRRLFGANEDWFADAYLLYRREAAAEFFAIADPIIKPHMLASGEAGFDGKVAVSLKRAGTLWLCANHSAGRSTFWRQKIEVKPGENRILIDQRTGTTI